MTRHHSKQSQYSLAKAMFEYYKSGHSAKATGERFGFSVGGVRTLFNKHGFKFRTPGSNRYPVTIKINKRETFEQQTMFMYADYTHGFSLREIAEKYQKTQGAIRARFTRRGLEL